MKSPRTIRCHVITVDTQSGEFPAGVDRPSYDQPRPSELLPWADPYIAGLVSKLQAEVREEVKQREPARPLELFGAPIADLEWPWDEAESFDAPMCAAAADRAATEELACVG